MLFHRHPWMHYFGAGVKRLAEFAVGANVGARSAVVVWDEASRLWLLLKRHRPRPHIRRVNVNIISIVHLFGFDHGLGSDVF